MTSRIPVHIQVTAALHFFAEGGYQRGVGQDSFVALSQPSTGRCIHSVCNAVSDLLADRWIVFPTTAAQRERVQQGFLQVLGFPGVIAHTHTHTLPSQLPMRMRRHITTTMSSILLMFRGYVL